MGVQQRPFEPKKEETRREICNFDQI